MAEWIPVEERLPDADEGSRMVLGTIRKRTDEGIQIIPVTDFGVWSGFTWLAEDGTRLMNITHWLDPHPLPGEEEPD